MNADTRAWLATRFQNVAYRIANGGQGIPPGHVVIPEDELQALIEGRLAEEDDDQPVDPDEMEARSHSVAMAFNEMVSPAVTHAGSIRKGLIDQGFSEDGAEQLAGNLFMMACSQIVGTDNDFQ